jgi:hypothetical protein
MRFRSMLAVVTCAADETLWSAYQPCTACSPSRRDGPTSAQLVCWRLLPRVQDRAVFVSSVYGAVACSGLVSSVVVKRKLEDTEEREIREKES